MSPRLADGREITIRPIRPDDKRRLAAGHALMSPETQRMRYHAPKPHLTDADLRFLTEVDGVDHVAYIAVAAGGPDVALGVGRFVRDRARPDTAEFAIVVADPFQGAGIGRAIAARLADAAVERGIRRFTATVLHENMKVRRLLTRISRTLAEARWSDGAGELVFELAA